MTDSDNSVDGTEHSPSVLVDWLRGAPNDRALRVQHDDDPLGPCFYAVIDGELIYHPGSDDDGRELGVVGPTSRAKLSFDMAEYDVGEVDIEDTPFRPSHPESGRSEESA